MARPVAAFIVNYNMPERADALAEHIRKRAAWPVDIYLIDNGSDLTEKAANTNVVLDTNCQTTNGWLAGMRHADTVCEYTGKKYFAYWFLITSAEFVDNLDPLTRLVEFMADHTSVAGIHPALTQDSTTAWKHLKDAGTGQARRVHMIDNIAALWRADWFDSIGRFDPALYMGHGIDLETSWKARRDGMSLWVHDGVKIKKVSNIGYTMQRMNMTAEQRQKLARESMNNVLIPRYGANYWERLQYEYWNS